MYYFVTDQDESRKEFARMVDKSQATLHVHKWELFFWNTRETLESICSNIYCIELERESFWKLRIQRVNVREILLLDSIDQTFAVLVNKAYGVLTIEMNRAHSWYETTEITVGSWKIAWH